MARSVTTINLYGKQISYSDLPQREFDADKAYHYKKSGHSGKIPLSAADLHLLEQLMLRNMAASLD